MSDFKSKALFEQISDGLKSMDDKEKKDIQKKVRFINHYSGLYSGPLSASCCSPPVFRLARMPSMCQFLHTHPEWRHSATASR